MEKHKYSKEEVEEWRKEHRGVFYFNRNDSNMFIPRKYGIGFSPNFANPGACIITIVVIGLIVMIAVVSTTNKNL
jgi:uncharacterized membrane protein